VTLGPNSEGFFRHALEFHLRHPTRIPSRDRLFRSLVKAAPAAYHHTNLTTSQPPSNHTLVMKRFSSKFSILTSGAAALLAALVVPQAAHAGTFDYVTGTYTETFDSLGTAGLSTSTLTNDLPNTGGSPWTVAATGAHTGANIAVNTTTAIGIVSDGNQGVVNPGQLLFNNGTTNDPDRALGSGNTTSDPTFDLTMRNNSGHALLGMKISFDTEWWRGGSTAGNLDTGYALLWSPTGLAGSYTQLATAASLNTAALAVLNGNDPLNRTNTLATLSLATPLAANGLLYFRWFDSNDTGDGPDANTAIDNVTFTEVSALVYNRSHAVGGTAPNGTLGVGLGNYWLSGATPAAFTDGALINFAQDGDATIDVPAAITAGMFSSNATGTYTLNGPGAISGSLTKTGAGNITLNSTNAFASRTLGGGGTVTVGALNALGTTGSLTMAAGGTNLVLNADNTLTGTLDGAVGALNKSGSGALIFTGTGTGTAVGGINLSGGKISAVVPLALGGAQTITITNNAILEIANTVEIAFSPKIIIVGAGGATISATNPTAGQGLLVNVANAIQGSAPITKTGAGTIRFNMAEPNLSSPWTINGGALELNTNPNGIGTGAVTVNTGGALVLNGGAALLFTNNITLNGGMLFPRTGGAAVYGNATTTINVTADSGIAIRSYSSPAGAQNLTVGGKLTGGGGIAITGPTPAIAANGTLTLTNATNTYSGHLIVNSLQTVISTPLGGVGTTLGTSSISLRGGSLTINDNGTANNGTLAYGNNVSVEAPSEAGFPGAAIINVNRGATGAFAGNTVQFGTLALSANSLTVNGTNGYGVKFGATTLTGDATVATNTGVTLGPVTGSFGLTKTGTGNLTLNGASTYTGPTTSTSGVLTVNGSVTGGVSVTTGTLNANGSIGGNVTAVSAIINLASTIGGSLSLSNASVLNGVGTINGGTTVGASTVINPGDLAHHGVIHSGNTTFGTVAGETSTINFFVDPVVANRGYVDAQSLTITSGATITVKLVNDLPSVGMYPIVDYTGTTISDADFAAFTLAPILNPRITAVLNHNKSSNIIELNVTAVDAPRWSGAGNGVWTSAAQVPQNWQLVIAGTGTNYIAGEEVLFDNNAVNKSVHLTAENVSPSLLTFNNSGAANGYTIDGTSSIEGPVVLTKKGTGDLNIQNINTFTGSVDLLGGTITVASVAPKAFGSPLGAGDTLNFDGGGLNYTGPVGSTDRTFNVNGGGGTVNSGSNDLTLSGNLTGTGILNKTGAGKLILTGTGSTIGGITISAGTLALVDGSGSPGTGPMVNNAVLLLDSSTAVTINNAISGPGVINKINTGSATLGGASANTSTGLTTVSSGTLFAGKPSGVNAIGGDLLVSSGGIFRYAGDTAFDEIADTATVTLDGGIFGDPANTAPANPSFHDTIGALIIQNNGSFASGRNAAVAMPFIVTGATTVTSGTLLTQRGGAFMTGSLSVEAAGTIKLDGGSTTPASESKITVGAGGLTIHDGIVDFNTGASPITGTSVGSILVLNGNVTTTGTVNFTRPVAGDIALKANVDLGGAAARSFSVTGNLNLGTAALPILVTNGGLLKTGPGTLQLNGVNPFAGILDVEQGTVNLVGTIPTSAELHVAAGAILDTTGSISGLSVPAAQKLSGSGSIVSVFNTQIDGTLTPGGLTGAPSIGTLSFNAPVTLGVASNSVFEANKTGATLSSDLVAITGAAITYGGTLHLTLSGDQLTSNATFNLFDADSFSGVFNLIDEGPLPSGYTWDTTKLTVDGTVSVLVPEPTGCALLLGGLSLLASRRRRRES
jgi:fibronectin-binding autotransporter adhesin